MNLLLEIIEKCRNLLPTQGPITSFVCLNPLQNFEDTLFESALEKNLHVFKNKMLFSEQSFFKRLDGGRINFLDLKELLLKKLGSESQEFIAGKFNRFDICWKLLTLRQKPSSHDEVKWLVSNFFLIKDLDSSSFDKSPQKLNELFLNCLSFVEKNGEYLQHCETFPRPRDLLFKLTGFDSDTLVHELLIKFCSVFLDQGFAIWDLPQKNRGFINCFRDLVNDSEHTLGTWTKDLSLNLMLWAKKDLTPLECIMDSVEEFDIEPTEIESFIRSTIFALRGWAGMINQLELRPDKIAQQIPPNTFLEFLAIRILLDKLALRYLLNKSWEHAKLSIKDFWKIKNSPHVESKDSSQYVLAWELLLVVASGAKDSKSFIPETYWDAILKECKVFNSFQRQLLFQKAFEKKLYDEFLSSLITNKVSESQEKPNFQTIFCIDDREESLRRHLEEIEPLVETFSGPGFFSVPMYYKGETDSFYSPLCPIIMTPTNWVKEVPFGKISRSHRKHTRTMHTIQRAKHELHIGSRKFSTGTILANTMGFFASIPLALGILFPRFFHNLKTRMAAFHNDKQVTRLTLERFEEPPSKEDLHNGFSLPELAKMGERLLRDIGLTNNIARLVIILGHGSVSVNNPHLSAYDCGACGGSPGGANARALAQTLNDPRVREIISNNGLSIPESTIFLGGLHNTCNNDIDYFDLDLLPQSHQEDFVKAKYSLEEASKRNAHERCRRFMSAPASLTYIQAKQHVEGRSADLAQPRAEFGHATNAFCIVGRRSRSKNIFLDRRAFLVSYDPNQDNEEKDILARILGAAIPVCSGINLQYFFSRVDVSGWGSGTKLPHNPTSLLGVMDGSYSDLRTGLPKQGTEIHEPVRILFVLECKPDGIKKIFQRLPSLANTCYNGWVNLALIDPDSSKTWILEDCDFKEYKLTRDKVPFSENSISWYSGNRGNLDFCHLINPVKPN